MDLETQYGGKIQISLPQGLVLQSQANGSVDIF